MSLHLMKIPEMTAFVVFSLVEGGSADRCIGVLMFSMAPILFHSANDRLGFPEVIARERWIRGLRI